MGDGAYRIYDYCHYHVSSEPRGGIRGRAVDAAYEGLVSGSVERREDGEHDYGAYARYHAAI